VQNIVVKQAIVHATPTTRCFSFNMPGVDEIFPGFTAGDFALLYGSPSVNALTSLLCVRAQLPMQLGGLASNVVFIDGGITFRLYRIARLAQLHQLNPEKVLEKIFISRAFTAYQLTSLIMEKLEETVKTYNAKIVIVSDIAGFFLDTNVAAEEAQRVYRQILSYLSSFAQKHQVIVVATYLPHENSRRNMALQEMTHADASTVLYFAKTKYAKYVALEKHSSYTLKAAKLLCETTTLTDFMGGNSGQNS
jgi:phage gp36-like protein